MSLLLLVAEQRRDYNVFSHHEIEELPPPTAKSFSLISRLRATSSTQTGPFENRPSKYAGSAGHVPFVNLKALPAHVLKVEVAKTA